MTRIVSRFPLPPMSLGTERHLTVHAYGDPDAAPTPPCNKEPDTPSLSLRAPRSTMTRT